MIMYLLTVEQIADITGCNPHSIKNHMGILGSPVAFRTSSTRGKKPYFYAMTFDDLRKISSMNIKYRCPQLMHENGYTLPRYRLISGSKDGKYPSHYVYDTESKVAYKCDKYGTSMLAVAPDGVLQVVPESEIDDRYSRVMNVSVAEDAEGLDNVKSTNYKKENGSDKKLDDYLLDVVSQVADIVAEDKFSEVTFNKFKVNGKQLTVTVKVE